MALIGLVVIPTLAQVECGWLLMVPPYSFASRAALPQVPLIQWEQVSAFDTAEQCERSISREYVDHEAQARQGEPNATRLFAQYLYARCLPASQVPVR